MKTGTTGPNQKANNQPQNNQKRPQNKDDLDSREGLEQTSKGDDITHNKKEVHNAPKKSKK